MPYNGRVVIVGGSDAGIQAGLRAREMAPDADVTVLVADEYPNFSICGLPYWLGGEVRNWHDLANRTLADLESLAPEASAPGPASDGFSLLSARIWRGSLECAILPVCGDFGRVWADGALRLPNAELLPQSCGEWIRNARGGDI